MSGVLRLPPVGALVPHQQAAPAPAPGAPHPGPSNRPSVPPLEPSH